MRSFNGRLSAFLPIRSANVSRLEPTWRWSAVRVPTKTLDREWGRRPTLGRASSTPTASLDDSSGTGRFNVTWQVRLGLVKVLQSITKHTNPLTSGSLIGSRTPIRVCKKMCLWHSNFSKSVVTKICKGGKHIYGIHAYIVHHYMHTWYTINMQVCGIEGKTQ